MAGETNIEALKALIEAIKDEETIAPSNVPVDVYLQEANYLYNWCMEDRQELIAKGINIELIDTLSARIESLRLAEVDWQLNRHGQDDTQEEWSGESEKAYQLRDDIIDDFKFAFRKSPEILKKIAAINEGIGHADLFQDLAELNALGKENQEPLRAINFDFTLLDKAAEYSRNLPNIFNKAKIKKSNTSVMKIFRDKCYTYLKLAVDEIRGYGQYVFRKNDKRKKGYYSEYLRKIRAKKSTENKNPENP